jgi:hypothetical protein
MQSAFEVDFDNLNMDDWLAQQNVETKWLRSGEVISVGGKVYGFRVDNVHNTVYKMLGNMQRGVCEDIIEEEEEESKVEEEN